MVENLDSVVIGNSVKYIGNSAFEACLSLSSIILPKSIRVIGENAFRNCSRLRSVTCLRRTPPNIDSYPFPFSNKITLHVLPNCKEAYLQTFPWSKFYKIMEDARE